MTFQELIFALERYWASQGCVIQHPYDIEVGAGTFNPATFLRALGPEPWKVAYVEPSRRPTDGRYGENPNRLQHYYQYQVIMKPSPLNIQELYLDSLKSFGIDPLEHDIRFVEDDWESPTLGATGLGWEVWLDGMEVTQFTYFQKVAGFDLDWARGVTWGDVHHEGEVQFSKYNFEVADVPMHLKLFEMYEAECQRLLKEDLVLPAYDYVMKASHAFNMLDARGAIGVAERMGYILRVRRLARGCAERYVALRERLGFPLMKNAAAAANSEK